MTTLNINKKLFDVREPKLNSCVSYSITYSIATYMDKIEDILTVPCLNEYLCEIRCQLVQ